jgi:hypothetical protein
MNKILFNPFEKFSEKIILVYGIGANLIGLLFAFYFNVKFTGFLKVNYLDSIVLISVLLQTFLIISVFSVLLFFVGKIINTKTRLIDIFITVLIARIPFYFMTFFNFKDLIFQHINRLKILVQTNKISGDLIFDSPVIILFYIVSILVVVWAIVLLYKGFRTATNAKESKHIFYFIIGFLVSEIITRTLIYNLN